MLISSSLILRLFTRLMVTGIFCNISFHASADKLNRGFITHNEVMHVNVDALSSGSRGNHSPVTDLRSPDEHLVFEFEIRSGLPGYSVYFDNKKLIGFSALNLIFKNDSLSQGVRLEQTTRLDSAESYMLMTGRSSQVNDSFRQLTLYVREINAPNRLAAIQVRAFNDGIAFRYMFPKHNVDSLQLAEERSEFNITGDPFVHALVQDDFENAHEGNYMRRAFSQLPIDSLLDMPMLFAYPDNVCMAITEAALLDYAGMYLVKTDNGLISRLSPHPVYPGYAVVASLPHSSPWRVIMISHGPARFLETNIITDLAPPLKIKDLSWLKPGKTTFPWWNGNVTADTLNAPGNNFVTQQYYIDFCARSNIEYHSVVEYGLHQWYQDDGVSFMPGPNSNVLKPVPGLDMKQVCEYAHGKGVGIRVWVHWKALYPKLDSAFALFEQWGISGMMVDFLNRDDQQMVNIQTEILEKAAAHHLHIQFHGAYKPTGLNRTYPNEFTREGTLNYEADKWNPLGVGPDHDLDVAYTRLIAGSTDYHLGGFRAVVPEKFRAQYTRPLVLGTRAHMLAMYVVLENANAMVCDYPEAYEIQPGFDFIQEIPTVWDETHVIGGSPDKFLLIARKKDNVWWIGGINNSKSDVTNDSKSGAIIDGSSHGLGISGAIRNGSSNARTVEVSLDFLKNGNWEATIYQDDLKTPFNPNGIRIKTIPVNASTILEIPMSAGGGIAIKIRNR